MADDHSDTADGIEPPSAPRPHPRRRFLYQAGASLGAIGSARFGHAREADGIPGAQPEVRSYRRLGRTELKISDISFGSSRLRTGGERLVSHALDRGVNYFDTADSYTRGQSEQVIGRALKGARDKVVIVSKSHASSSEGHASIMRSLDQSLARLQTDYLDVYFNHAVNDTGRLTNPEWFEFAERAKQAGKIRFTGISGHAGRLIDILDRAVDGDLVDVLLVSYNFGQDPAFYESLTRSFDRIATQQGLPAVLKRAKTKDMGVVAMKTLMGARLNDMRSYESAGLTFSQAAFRWTLSNPDVDGLIVSMTGTDQIDEYLGASGAAEVSARDLELLRRYASLNGTTYCRQACNDCEGACPYGVPIADVLRTRMYAVDYGDVAFARQEYAQLAADASPCLSCSGAPCQDACSHGLNIAALCAPSHRMLS